MVNLWRALAISHSCITQTRLARPDPQVVLCLQVAFLNSSSCIWWYCIRRVSSMHSGTHFDAVFPRELCSDREYPDAIQSIRRSRRTRTGQRRSPVRTYGSRDCVPLRVSLPQQPRLRRSGGAHFAKFHVALSPSLVTEGSYR